MTVGSKNKQKTTLIKSVCGTKNAPALPPWWCMEYTHHPLLVTDNNTLHGLLYYCCTCKCLLLVRRFTCSLCLAHHLKQKQKYQFSILFLFLLFYKNRFAKEICTCNVFYSSWLQFISSRYARRQCMLMMSSNDIPVKVQWHQRH